MRFIEGQVEGPDDPRIAALEDEVSHLQAELAKAKAEASLASRQSARAMGTLRRQLSPLYRALQDVFGELEAAGADEAVDHAPQTNARVSAVWASWKDKLGIGPAKVIDALLLHGEMNTVQLSVTTGYHRNTVPQYVSALNRAGLINKNGGKFSLKAI